MKGTCRASLVAFSAQQGDVWGYYTYISIIGTYAL